MIYLRWLFSLRRWVWWVIFSTGVYGLVTGSEKWVWALVLFWMFIASLWAYMSDTWRGIYEMQQEVTETWKEISEGWRQGYEILQEMEVKRRNRELNKRFPENS